MSRFERKFARRDWNEYPVVTELLKHWVLPGEESGTHGLRLAVRNGYCNLYRNGQSIAKLWSSSRKARIEIHRKYLDGIGKGMPTEPTGKPSGDYRILRDEMLRDRSLVAAVRHWIETAGTYSGAEKCFVDDLVEANSNVVDLEMGLSAYDDNATAPRMDLVVIENTRTGPALAFWEAKCADNSEARSTNTPHVVAQVQRYHDWMGHADRAAHVVEAYRNACGVLVQLADDAGKTGSNAVSTWRAFRDDERRHAIHRPGVVVGGYCPASFQAGKPNAIENAARSFEDRGHRKRLEEEGLTVAFLRTANDLQQPLPSLSGALS